MGLRDLSVCWRHLPLLALALWVCVAQAQQAGGPRNGLVVSMPNGFATISVDDMRLKTTAGDFRWSRYWNGQEWAFNPQWESLSQSWRNLTGSQAADTTGAVGNSNTGSAGSCWVSADEDWAPPAAGSDGIVPMLPARSTPFNRRMADGASAGDYAAPVRVTLDYATLCPGVAVASNQLDQEALRRGNALFVGDSGHYAFNNRSTLDRTSVDALPTVPAASPYAQLGTGRISLAPVKLAKGYRWRDRAGEWIHYNSQGQVVAYGDRNNNTVWMQRDADGILRGVVDANGRVLLTLHYDADQTLAEVRDYPDASNPLDLPARAVRYQYDASKRMTLVTDVRGNVTTYEYDNFNHITKLTDPEGHAEQLAYSGNIVSRYTAPDGGVTDYAFDYDGANKQFIAKKTGPATAAGRRVDEYTHNRVGQLVKRVANGRVDDLVSYDTAARTESHTNARGFVEVRTRDEFGLTVQVQLTDGSLISAAYSALHLQVMEQTNEAGTKTVFERDGAGNLLKMTQAVGLPEQRITEYAVNGLGETIKATRKGRVEIDGSTTPDVVWAFSYDAAGQLSEGTDPEGNVRRYVFNRAGHLVKYTDPRGKATSYEVGAHGNLLSSTNALGHVRRLAYDKVGNLLTLTDARGKSTSARYNALNRLLETTSPVGGKLSLEYDAQGLPVKQTDEDGRIARKEYDSFLRVVREIDGMNNATEYGYTVPDSSQAGMLGSLASPAEVKFPTYTSRTRYDARERPVHASLLHSNRRGPETLDSSAKFDARGLRIAETDPYGKSSGYTYDAFGQLTESADRLGGKTRYRYDARGNLLQLLDANGNTHKFEYDRNDRLTKESLPLGQAITYAYDAAGNLSRRVNRNGYIATYTHDAANRLTELKQTNASGALQRTTLYTWDAEDNLINWTDADATRSQTTSATLTYDDAGRKTAEKVTFHTGFSLNHAYKYSAAGLTTGITWPDGTEIGYGYSPTGALSEVTIPGEGSINIAQFRWKVPAKTVFPGGVVREETYDGLLNLERAKVGVPLQTPTLDLENSYGRNQELLESARTDSVSAISSTSISKYTYDDEGRLLAAANNSGAGSTTTEIFGLDSLGNRVLHSDASGAWIYDANNRLLSRGAGAAAAIYDWDSAGNLVGVTEADGRKREFRYDSQDRLIQVGDESGNLIARYGYDPLGRRIWREVFRGVDGMLLPEARRFFYAFGDGGLLAVASQVLVQGTGTEWGAVSEPAFDVLFGLRPRSYFSTAYLFFRSRNAESGAVYAYLQADHLGAPVQALDRSGKVIWAGQYAAFGDVRNVLPVTYSLVDSVLRLPGQQFDLETGFHYNFRRFYDPRSGRYISSDPIGLNGGVNLYSYARANPVNEIDPTGLCDVTCQVAMQAAGLGPQWVRPSRRAWDFEISEAQHMGRNVYNQNCPQKMQSGTPGGEDGWNKSTPYVGDAYHRDGSFWDGSIFFSGDISKFTRPKPIEGYPHASEECVYDCDGNLIDKGPRAGTFNFDGRPIWNPSSNHGPYDMRTHERNPNYYPFPMIPNK